MPNDFSSDSQDVIAEALRRADAVADQQTDGKWLEGATASAGPHIREWDLSECHLWTEWPEREQYFPGTTDQDVGIDAVGVRRSDGRHVAIQCKSRKLDAHGNGAPIAKHETDKFAAASAGDFWADRWIVTNGASELTGHSQQSISMSGTLKLVNIVSDLRNQQSASASEDCPHCAPDAPEDARQTKSCMQDDAVEASVRILREHARSDSG